MDRAKAIRRNRKSYGVSDNTPKLPSHPAPLKPVVLPTYLASRAGVIAVKAGARLPGERRKKR